MRYLIGIDGGGTKTDLLLCSTEGRVMKRLITTGTNANDIGFDAANKVLCDGIVKLLGGIDDKEVCLFAGLSGGITGKNRERFGNSLKESFPKIAEIHNDSDVINALSCGLVRRDGATVIAGTGSIGYARKGEALFRVGGWGYLIDKGGSGYDFGRDALYYSLCALDGRGEKTLLTEMIEAKLSASLPDSIADIYKKGRGYIASFAPLVFQAFSLGDAIAEHIISQNMRELSHLFNSVASFLDFPVCPVVLNGGLFSKFSDLEPYILPHLTNRFEFILPKLPPAAGAVIECAKFAGIDTDEWFVENLINTIKEVQKENI